MKRVDRAREGGGYGGTGSFNIPTERPTDLPTYQPSNVDAYQVAKRVRERV